MTEDRLLKAEIVAYYLFSDLWRLRYSSKLTIARASSKKIVTAVTSICFYM